MKNDCVKSNISIDKQIYYVEQDLFDIVYSTINNSGTARSVGYYDNLLSPRIDISKHRLCLISGIYSWYCLYCQNMYLFLVFNASKIDDYRNSCLVDIYCTDTFYEFKDFASVQIGSQITDVEQIDKSIIYKKTRFSSVFRVTKHLCKEGIVTIEWKKEKDYVVNKLSYDANEYVQDLYNTISK